MDTRFRGEVPVARKDDFGDLVEFSTAYIHNYYELGGANIDLSARDLRYAAQELGYELAHEEALILLEHINNKVIDERTKHSGGGFLASYLYGMNHSEG